jgi:hypothetical protein
MIPLFPEHRIVIVENIPEIFRQFHSSIPQIPHRSKANRTSSPSQSLPRTEQPDELLRVLHGLKETAAEGYAAALPIILYERTPGMHQGSTSGDCRMTSGTG